MEHYCKGRNEEEELRKDNIPLKDLPEQFSWLEVTGMTRVKSAVGPVGKLLREVGAVVLGGSGPNTAKVVTLAEIIKRRNKHVHQVTNIGEKTVKEFWDPKTEELDPLVVTRLVPTIHILLDLNGDRKQEGFMEVLWGDGIKEATKKPKQRKKKKKEEDLIKEVDKLNLS